MAKLETLPIELLFIILKDVRDIRGLASLAQMNRHLNGIATPVLYRAAVKKKRHEALVYSAKIGNIKALELLKDCGQDLRARANNKKKLTRAWDHKQALIRERNGKVPRLKKDIRKLQRAKSMLNYKKYPEVKPPGWKDEADEKIEKKRKEIENIREEIAAFNDIPKDPRRKKKKANQSTAFQDIGAIHAAAMEGHSETVRWLLRNGVSAHQKCFLFITLLDDTGSQNKLFLDNATKLAAAYQRLDVMHVFYLDHITQPDSVDDPLWETAIKGHQAESAMKLVVSVASSLSHNEAGLPHQIPSENGIIDAVNLLLDPLDCLEAYYDAESEDINLWKERKQQLEEEQHGRVPKRSGGWQTRRKRRFERKEYYKSAKEEKEEVIATNDHLTIELGKPCNFWGRKKCRGKLYCWGCTMHGVDFWKEKKDKEPDVQINKLSINSPGSDVSMT